MESRRTERLNGCGFPILVGSAGLAVSVVLELLIFGQAEAAGTVSAIAHVIIGLSVYLWHGRNEITPLGMFSFGSAVFMGIPYFVAETVVGQAVTPAASVYAFLVYVCVVAISALCTRVSTEDSLLSGFPGLIRSFRVDAMTMVVLVLGLAFGLWSSPLGLAAPLRQGFFYVGAIYLSLAAVAAAAQGRRAVAGICLALALSIVALFYVTLFSGSGRLNVVSLLFCVLIVLSLTARTRLVKLAPLLFSPLVVFWAGVVRGPGGGAFSMRSLGSAVAPLVTFSNIVELFQHRLPATLNGSTYMYPLYFWVPRQWWPGKPEGLGSAYVRWIQPELAGTGHSVAVSYLGEGVANFALPGVIVAAVFAAVLLVVVTKFRRQLAHRTRGALMTTYGFVVVVLLEASILDLIWADSNTWAQRGLTRILVVLLIASIGGLVSLITRRKPERQRMLANNENDE